jgi:hypothetical protein
MHALLVSLALLVAADARPPTPPRPAAAVTIPPGPAVRRMVLSLDAGAQAGDQLSLSVSTTMVGQRHAVHARRWAEHPEGQRRGAQLERDPNRAAHRLE